MIAIICCSFFHSTFCFHSESWNDFLPQLIVGIVSSIIGFSGAYLLFWRGLQNEKNKKEDSNNKELDDYYKYLKFSIQRILQPASEQATEFGKIVEILSVRKADDIEFKSNTSFNFKWFESFDKLKLQKAFFKNFPGTIKDKVFFYNQLLSRIDLLNIISNEYEKEFNRFLEIGNQNIPIFNKGKNILFHIHDTIRAKKKSSPENKDSLTPFEQDMMEAASEWYTIPEHVRHDIFITYDHYISTQAFKNVVIKYEPPELLDAIRICSFAFRNFERNQQIALQRFTNYAQSIEKSILRFRVMLRKMEL